METKKLQFSLFFDKSKGIYTNTPKETISFERLISIYKSSYVEKLTNQIQQAKDFEKAELKKRLPFITPYGTFEPTRANENIVHYNSKLIAFDFDFSINDLKLVNSLKSIIKSLQGCALCCISPRGNGIKSLFIIEEEIDLKEHYNTLKDNKENIIHSLGLYNYFNEESINKIIKALDNSQFKLPQPFFIANDTNLFYNLNPEPLKIKLNKYINTFVIQTYNKPKQEVSKGLQIRIDKYINNAVDRLISFYNSLPEGERHDNIIRVSYIKSILHYAPHLEAEIETSLKNAVCKMYGDKHKTYNAEKTFNNAWNHNNNVENKRIEEIKEDYKEYILEKENCRNKAKSSLLVCSGNDAEKPRGYLGTALTSENKTLFKINAERLLNINAERGFYE